MTFTRRAMYRRGHVPGQIDHPGWLSKVVEDEAQFEQALAEGWQADMREVAAPVPFTPVAYVAYGPELSVDEQRDADVPVRFQVDAKKPGRKPKKI